MMSNPNADFFDDDDEYYDDYEDDSTNNNNDDNNNKNNNDDDEDTTDNINDQSELTAGGNNDDEDDFMNEEGSGGYAYAYSKYRNNLYKNRLRLDFLEKYRRKHQKTQKLIPDDDEDDDLRREGSGNFDASDDEEDDDDAFFASKRKSNSKYFRKNTNDAIKIISTPHGKVGIVYQQTDLTKEKNKENTNIDVSSSSGIKPQQKITPVLTADGKVALLYRGASENTKYEPILNLTHNFNYDNKTSAVNNAKLNNNFDGISDIKEEESSTTEEILKPKILEDSSTTTTPGPQRIDNEQENSILPSINRPLSEVLGIKKNQFKQFRIKDTPTSSTTPENDKLTTVDLNKLPKSPNYDYDFGLDVTEYDERNERYNKILYSNGAAPKVSESTNPTISTSEMLSKTEVVNLAIIPHFDEEFERQQHYREHENRRHHRQRHRHRHINEDLSGVHCIMQAMMGIAAISTVFGMLGAFFKQRILDQIRLMHW